MTKSNPSPIEGRNGFSRRQFMAGCSACAGLAMLPLQALAKAKALPRAACCEDLYPKVKANVRLVFSHIKPGTPTWPQINFDYETRKRELMEELMAGCPDINFLPITLMNEQEAKDMLARDQDVDGYLCFMIGIWTRVPQTIAEAGKPTIYVDDLYSGSGEFLVAYSAAQRKGLKVAGVSSSKMEDVILAANTFAALKKLRNSKILVVSNQERLWADPQEVTDLFGTQFELVRGEELDSYYQKADREKAKIWAKQWTNKARKVVEPSDQTLEDSGAMYVAMQNIMKEKQAQAITIDCLTLFYSNKMSAYPCMGFFQLNNDGLVGACESDINSTVTMLLMTYLTGRPGYISDPVIDTSKNQIIYAHCVAPSKMFGPNGKSNRYDIRDHSEDRQGACVRSLLPLGEMTTSLEFHASKKAVLMHQAVTVENVEEDRACRTKVAAEVVGDISKLLKEWDTWGWHRVTFYGDYKIAVENLAKLAGMEVVKEA